MATLKVAICVQHDKATTLPGQPSQPHGTVIKGFYSFVLF